VLQRFVLRALERSDDVRTVRGWLSRVLTSTVADWQRMGHEPSTGGRHERERRRSPRQRARTGCRSGRLHCLYKILPTLKPEYAEIVWRDDLLGEPRDRIAVSMLRCASTMAASLEEAARGDLPRLRRDRVPRLQLLAKLRSTLLRAAAPICQCGQAIACLSHAEN
jgi:hypothetical protein